MPFAFLLCRTYSRIKIFDKIKEYVEKKPSEDRGKEADSVRKLLRASMGVETWLCAIGAFYALLIFV